jgi:hypothetical protein|tara:strand:- start:208 stop:507 length:300 start_codon:yes stop_codon:yes gene_type:complete
MVDKLTPPGTPSLGVIETKTTKFGGHPPEFWAERLTEKIVSYSDNSDPHIREQAREYKDLIYQLSLIYIKNALKSYKATLIQDFIKAGHEDLANIIKRV